ncbi:OLC1v1032615C1 [Oldenlandia corymbosa var. corymbosa]|uniref:OLC1v1032615C1 n=1 Tax=Oldenlandia corymbosa var. corymbosa TaxID=529605 RepID=A0AAV1CP43_OLDCO|nr:OLC1v1032615C1 [Oldenlandia corymbosa var. corymbosa]
MDLWVVAAAAGAGYLGKYWQNSSLSEKERLLLSSSKLSTHRSLESWKFLQQIREKTCPLKRLAREKAYEGVFQGQNYLFDQNEFDGDPDLAAFASASTSDRVKMVEDFRARWLKSFQKISAKKSSLHNTEPSSSCGFCKKKLHKNRSSKATALGKAEEYRRVLLGTMATEESQVEESLWPNIAEDPLRRTSSYNALDLREDTRRVSASNSFDSWEDLSRRSISCDEICTCLSTSSTNDDTEYVEVLEPGAETQGKEIDEAVQLPGKSNDLLLFLVGLTIGMLPTAASSKREMQKMNEKLEEAMTLVQDLKEELDMNENFTVKELMCNGSESPSSKTPSLFNQKLSLSISQQEPQQVTSDSRKLADDEKSENALLMSRIEAELEAELERLQMSMDLERRSNFAQLDVQSEGYRIGSIKTNAFNRQYDSDTESDEASDNMTRPPNYAVSPRELSIRLHELIESQLEARIKELETALQNNQHRFHSPESQRDTSISVDEYNNTESPATPEDW